MAPLGPWPAAGDATPVAVAVSGGADSTALALLARSWAGRRRVRLLALVVDHALRPASAAEAAATIARLSRLGIEARLLTLRLAHGPGLAERARIARYAALTDACRSAGAIDLLLGHHADDQAETVLMRRRAGSGPDGLAGMAALVETRDVRLVRPLLRIPPARLRSTLAAHGVGWIEDPSNQDPTAQRTRLRQELAAIPGEAAQALRRETDAAGSGRMARQAAAALGLAVSARLHPEGFALLPPALLPAAALADLIRTVGGGRYPPAPEAVERLRVPPHAATLHGTRLLPAGRFGPGWLLAREPASIGPDCEAADGIVWDGRFRLEAGSAAGMLGGVRIAALGAAPMPGCRRPALPAAVRATLPALRRDGVLLAVPHLGWVADSALSGLRFRYRPAVPASGSALFADH